MGERVERNRNTERVGEGQKELFWGFLFFEAGAAKMEDGESIRPVRRSVRFPAVPNLI